MKRLQFATRCLVLTAVLMVAQSALAAGPPFMWPNHRAMCYNWHGAYAHREYGRPVALVVPPTAQLQTDWGWGVPSARISRIEHQFGRNYPGPGPFGGGYSYPPHWPRDTRQFGVYHVRGPW